MNAFTAESRDARMSLGIDGLVDKLRAPETLRRLLMLAKPATQSVGDFCLESMFHGVLIAAIMRRDYGAAYGALVTVLGSDVTGVTTPESQVTNVDMASKRFAKAAGR